MPIFIIPHRQRIWQAIASAYRPPNNPFALYAEDERIGKYHAGTLGINFQSGVNTLSLHNAWLTGYWPGGYPLRIPSEGRAASFPDMISPWTAASGMGYSIIQWWSGTATFPRGCRRTSTTFRTKWTSMAWS